MTDLLRNQQGVQNQTCSFCRKSSPAVFCTCLGTKTLLCLGCLSLHHEKYPVVFHPIFPIQAFNCDQESFQRRSNAFNQGKEELLGNIVLIEQCAKEFSDAIDQLAIYLTSYRDFVVSQLQAWKGSLESQITEAIEEVNATLFQDFPALQKPLSSALRNYQPGNLTLFEYKVDPTCVSTMVPNVLVSMYHEPELPVSEAALQQLFAVNGNEVLCFDLTNLEWRHFSSQGDLLDLEDSGASLTAIDTDKLFVCGRGKKLGIPHIEAEVYILERDGDALQLPGMLSYRQFCGVVFEPVTQTIYVFGGIDSYKVALKSSERYQFSSFQWEALPDMCEERRLFNPCIWASKAYLCGGFATSVEVFDLQTNLFTLLPGFLLPEADGCTAVVESGTLVVISRYHISRWGLNQQIGTSAAHQKYRAWSNCAPVTLSGVLYTVSQFDGVCRGLNLTTGVVEMELGIGVPNPV